MDLQMDRSCGILWLLCEYHLYLAKEIKLHTCRGEKMPFWQQESLLQWFVKTYFSTKLFFSDASPLVWYFKATRTRQSVIGGSSNRSFHLFSLLHNWILFPIGRTLIGLFGLSGNLGTNNFTNRIYFGCIKSICMHKWSGNFFRNYSFFPVYIFTKYVFLL